MKNHTKHLLLLLIIAMMLGQGCKKDSVERKETDKVSEIVAEQNKRLSKIVTTTTVKAYVHGRVLDEDGNALSGVNVKSGVESSTTDNEGYFAFGEISINKDYAVVKAEKTGYLKGIRTFTPIEGTSSQMEIRLLTKGNVQTVDATKGGSLSFDGGKVKLDFPAGSISDAEGNSYTGTVNVHARYINPETESFASAMPGNLVGLTENNELIGMISYGMAGVELADKNGNILQVAQGKTVKVTMPMIKDAPDIMPVWHFNETYGLWVETGRAAKEGSSYSFEANHFSTWNLDVFVEDGVKKVTLRMMLTINTPHSNKLVKVSFKSSNKTDRIVNVHTNENGEFTLLNVPRMLELEINTLCIKVKGSVNITKDYMEVNMLSHEPLTYISGQIKDCDGVYANKYFEIPGLNYTGKTDSQGRYNYATVICNMPGDGTKLPFEVIIHLSGKSYKKDTINLAFDKFAIIADVDFCQAVEVIHPLLNPNLTYGSVMDIDGNLYATIQIGTQTWMAENLKTTRYNDSTIIENITDGGEWFANYWVGINSIESRVGAWAYYNNDASYNELFGKLYNGYAVNTGILCPKGWHIPTNKEWEVIARNFKASDLKSMHSAGWDPEFEVMEPDTDPTNSSGFSAMPGGERIPIDFSSSPFEGMSSLGLWWSSSPGDYQYDGFGLPLYNGNDDVVYEVAGLGDGMSCRCIKD